METMNRAKRTSFHSMGRLAAPFNSNVSERPLFVVASCRFGSIGAAPAEAIQRSTQRNFVHYPSSTIPATRGYLGILVFFQPLDSQRQFGNRPEVHLAHHIVLMDFYRAFRNA